MGTTATGIQNLAQKVRQGVCNINLTLLGPLHYDEASINFCCLIPTVRFNVIINRNPRVSSCRNLLVQLKWGCGLVVENAIPRRCHLPGRHLLDDRAYDSQSPDWRRPKGFALWEHICCLGPGHSQPTVLNSCNQRDPSRRQLFCGRSSHRRVKWVPHQQTTTNKFQEL